MPEGFENFRCAIESRDEMPGLDILKVKILEEFETRHQKRKDDHGALAVKPKNYRGKEQIHTEVDKSHQKPRTAWKPKIKCFKCGRLGHRAVECYSGDTNRRPAAKIVNELYYAESWATSNACTVYDDPERKYWCLDSGCTTHLCKDKSKFTQLQPSTHEKLNLASNGSTNVEAKGNVCIRTKLDNNLKQVSFGDALYVPDLRVNLMSVAKMTEKGNKVIFEKNAAIVVGDDGRIQLKPDRIGDLYYIREEKEDVRHVDCEQSDAAKVKLWHERLGHLNVKDLTRLIKEEKIPEIKVKEEVKMDICEICIQGKLYSSPFPKESNRCTQLLEIIHSDVCGPMRTESLGGSKLVVSFIDDYSRWCQIYFCKRKSEVFQAFQKYKA